MPIAQLVGPSGADEKCVTFVIENEGHTLGNALRWIISGYDDVQFCGYTVPHPMEASMNFRIQMRKGKAVDALKRGLEDLAAVSDHVLEQFNQELDSFHEMKSS